MPVDLDHLIVAHSRIFADHSGPIVLLGAEVDGQRVEEFTLYDGDVFVVGNTSMAFKSL